MRTRALQYFNMIEVALAIAVIAIGLSSIMVLFPVGLNASSAAATDNNIPDAAEYMLSYLEADLISNWRTSTGAVTDNNKYITNTNSILPDKISLIVSSIGDTILADNDSSAWDDVESGIKRHKNIKGYFRFLKTTTIDSEEITDFAVDALVWYEPAFARYVTVDANGKPNYDLPAKEINKKAAIELCMELSWPVTQPHSKRETRLYRLTLLNPVATPADLL